MSNQNRPRRGLPDVLAALTLLLAWPVHAADQPVVAERVLTNLSEIWALPSAERAKLHRIRTEVVLYFFDPYWGNASGECQGKPVWLPIGDSPVAFKPGQRLAIDGVVDPLGERFVWERTQVRVLENNAPLPAEVVTNPSSNPGELRNHRVSIEGLIDGHIDDPTHFKLSVLCANTPAMVYVLTGTNRSALPFKEGDFIRAKGVFIAQQDRGGNLSDLAVWVASPRDIEVIGSLATDTRFSLPLVQSEDVQENLPPTRLLHVSGVVRKHEPGKWVTLWDSSGEIMVESKQNLPLRVGEAVEAIGYPFVAGVQRCLHRGLYRLRQTSAASPQAPLDETEPAVLRLAEQVRELTPSEAERRRPVRLRAVVTWSHSGSRFAYVQDASGGVRVMNPRWEKDETSKPGTIVMVEGVTAEGDFVPVVTNAVLRKAGWWTLEQGKLTTLRQALTGLEDGEWVEMEGYVREVTRTNGLERFELSTVGGEYVAWTPATQSFAALTGAIIRIQGACSAISNSKHQIIGIQVWVPDNRYIRVQEPPPENVFAGPLRRLGDLRRFSSQNALDQRVRTVGTVVLHVPGRYVYVQEGSDSIFALSQQKEPLQPGDRVEVAGFPGREGRRFLLREALYRKLSHAGDPSPMPLSRSQSVNLDLQGRLVTAKGRLLNVVEKGAETRLLIQTEVAAFEASLEMSPVVAWQRQALPLGSQVEVTGVYEVRSDEYGSPLSLFLRLRSWNDVRLLRRPSWWTAGRLGWTLVGAAAVSLVAFTWGWLIARKNSALRQTQAALQAAHDQLELRVDARTKDLASSLSLLSATLESTADGVMVTDQGGSMIRFNTKFARMWGVSPDTLEGQPEAGFFSFAAAQLKDAEGFLDRVHKICAHPEADTFDLLEFKDGRAFERYSQAQRLDGDCVGRVWCFRDVTERKRAEAELEQAHKQMLVVSRQVGMAEVAAGVLHNVGNVLNSVNVSATLIHEGLQGSRMSHLVKAVALLDENSTRLPEFLTQDPKGKLLCEYLRTLTRALVQERQSLGAEADQLRKSIEHIKVIVAMQQSYARVGGALEALDPAELMEDAIRINSVAFERSGIELVRRYQRVPRVLADRHKVLQILLNLLSNARHALETIPEGQRRVVASLQQSGRDRVSLKVRDNGQGIAAENLCRVFNQGFTTRHNGHGFGLHSGANAAREMNGALTVASDGPGKGATFILELSVDGGVDLPEATQSEQADSSREESALQSPAQR